MTSLAMIEAAATRLKGHIRRTPLLSSAFLNKIAGRRILALLHRTPRKSVDSLFRVKVIHRWNGKETPDRPAGAALFHPVVPGDGAGHTGSRPQVGPGASGGGSGHGHNPVPQGGSWQRRAPRDSAPQGGRNHATARGQGPPPSRIATDLCATIRPNPERMAAALTGGLGMIHADALSFALAAHMRRADAQATVKMLCREAIDTQTPLRDLAKRDWPDLDAALFDPAHQMGNAPATARAFAAKAAARRRNPDMDA